jgi:hypothetical protein
MIMTKIEEANKYKTNYITFIYSNQPSKTTNNLDTAISILDADHAKIKKIVWN